MKNKMLLAILACGITSTAHAMPMLHDQYKIDLTTKKDVFYVDTTIANGYTGKIFITDEIAKSATIFDVLNKAEKNNVVDYFWQIETNPHNTPIQLIKNKDIREVIAAESFLLNGAYTAQSSIVQQINKAASRWYYDRLSKEDQIVIRFDQELPTVSLQYRLDKTVNLNGGQFEVQLLQGSDVVEEMYIEGYQRQGELKFENKINAENTIKIKKINDGSGYMDFGLETK